MADGYPIKLVRDRTANVDTSEGLRYRPVRDRDEHVRRLRAKLVEEVGEYLIDPSLDEAVDIVAAVEALVSVDLECRLTDLMRTCEEKWAAWGGFEQGVVMETVEPDA